MPKQKPKTETPCGFCGKMVTGAGALKHLKSCAGRKEAIAKANAKPGKAQAIYHIQIQDAYNKEFFLHLEMNGDAKMKALDGYLKSIWLECCGHMSEFSGIPMSKPISSCPEVGATAVHIYDFGTSSETLVKVADIREGKPLGKHPIYLMLRNAPAEAVCGECKQPATQLCIECMCKHEDKTPTYCDKHADTHGCGDNYGEPMELVNSPRVGMCGYSGPADPPYVCEAPHVWKEEMDMPKRKAV